MSKDDDAQNVFAASMAGVRCWLQLFAAIVGFAVFFAVDPYLGSALLVGLLVIERPPGVELRPDFWRPNRWWPPFAVYVPFVLVWVAFATGYLRCMELLGQPIEPQAALQQLVSGEMAPEYFWPTVVLAVVLAPVTEEILFRGYLFGALSMSLPMWATQIVTATLFGLVHGMGHAIPIGVLSLLFGYLRQRYRSLWPSIVAHMVHNGLTVTLLVTWPELLDLFYNR